MTFHSILFPHKEYIRMTESLSPPDFFTDLNLDQLVESICARRQEYNLQPFFYAALPDINAIEYRQAVIRELGNETVRAPIEDFAEKMRNMRGYLVQADKLHSKLQKQRWFLDAADLYCTAVHDLAQALSSAPVKSEGLVALGKYISGYVQSDAFRRLQAETSRLEAGLAAIRYCLRIEDYNHRTKKNAICIEVRPYGGEADYSAEVEATFAKFQQEAGQDYRVKFSEYSDMNHVEAGILEQVARMHQDLFLQIEQYCSQNRSYLDDKLARFDREIQFYLAYRDFIEPIQQAGLQFCFPRLVENKAIYNYAGFDLALAHKLTKSGAKVVENDFYLRDEERILVVSGPNQGGKTTFARTFGQLHHMARLGLPVPGREAQLFMCDQIYTHFEKQEQISNLAGKLQEDLKRMQNILSQASPASIVILNEIFTSTTLQDSIYLSQEIMAKIIALGTLGVWVTFIDELASFSPATVSMVSTIVPENPAQRTYKILRQPADGLSYALSIAEKYRLTYMHLKERILS